MNNFFEFLNQQLEIGNCSLGDNVKMLLYKTDATVFDKIDFDDDEIYYEPLFYANFYSKPEFLNNQDALIIGYSSKEKYVKATEIKSDKFGRFYLPNIGWLSNLKENYIYLLEQQNGKIFLRDNEKIVNYDTIERKFVNENIEILFLPVELLDQFYYDVNKEIIDVEIIQITQKSFKYLSLAINLIEAHCFEYFQLMKMVLRKCVIFNTDWRLRNSFAGVAAQGICFLNAYQEDYNEVFFVDDLAHQSGHLILFSICYDLKQIFIIDPETEIKFSTENDLREKRTVYILLHALYTYYASFICIEACLAAKIFSGDKEIQALARICFYINKCGADLALIENNSNTLLTANTIFTEKGLFIYQNIKTNYFEIKEKYYERTRSYDLTNQEYNFSFSKFIQLNKV